MEDIFFLNPKTIETVIAIKNLDEPYGHKIARKTDTTYAHTCNILKKLKDEGIIDCQCEGRKNICYLTEDGESLVTHYQGVIGHTEIDVIKTKIDENPHW